MKSWLTLSRYQNENILLIPEKTMWSQSLQDSKNSNKLKSQYKIMHYTRYHKIPLIMEIDQKHKYPNYTKLKYK